MGPAKETEDDAHSVLFFVEIPLFPCHCTVLVSSSLRALFARRTVTTATKKQLFVA